MAAGTVNSELKASSSDAMRRFSCTGSRSLLQLAVEPEQLVAWSNGSPAVAPAAAAERLQVKVIKSAVATAERLYGIIRRLMHVPLSGYCRLGFAQRL